MKPSCLARAPLLLLALSIQYSCGASAATNDTAHHAVIDGTLKCADRSICLLASECCQVGMDDTGWIAAAVGWGLWLFTLILFCVGKVMNMHPDQPKYSEA